MEKYLVTIALCSSCTQKSVNESERVFTTKIIEKLQNERPDFEWQIQESSCMRVCPVDRITMGVSSSKNSRDVRMTVSKEATVESVVKEILSFFRPLQK